MSFIFSLLASLGSLAKAVLDTLSFTKKSGEDSRENEELKKEVAHDEKDMAELSKANEFMLRLSRDPAFRERMRQRLRPDGQDDK